MVIDLVKIIEYEARPANCRVVMGDIIYDLHARSWGSSWPGTSLSQLCFVFTPRGGVRNPAFFCYVMRKTLDFRTWVTTQVLTFNSRIVLNLGFKGLLKSANISAVVMDDIFSVFCIGVLLSIWKESIS